MSSLKLISPSLEYEASFIEMIEEWKAAAEPLSPWTIEIFKENFEEYISILLNASKGIGIPETFVPHSSFWLVNENKKILATSNLRHELNEKLYKTGGHIGYGVTPSERRKGNATKILELTLLEARKIGIEKALVTCNKTNIGSAKSIVKNGGKFWKETPAGKRITCYYWVEKS